MSSAMPLLVIKCFFYIHDTHYTVFIYCVHADDGELLPKRSEKNVDDFIISPIYYKHVSFCPAYAYTHLCIHVRTFNS